MRATKFEFEYRFWIISGIYFFGFALSAVDHTPFSVALRHLIAPSIVPGSPEAAMFSRMVAPNLYACRSSERCSGTTHFQVDQQTRQATSPTYCSTWPPKNRVDSVSKSSNPLYLGNLLMAAGIGVLASRAGFIFLVLTNWFFVYRLIFREEKALRQSQAETFLAYCQAVPRFWPSLRPQVPSGNRSPQWGQAFAGETFVWIFGLAELSIAITLNARVGGTVFLLAFLAYFIPVRLVKKRRARSETRTIDR